MHKYTLTFLLIVLLAAAARAQHPPLVPQGMFLADSAKIGEHVKYAFSYTYPRDADLVFPGANYDFFPFEYVDREIFTTRADSSYLTDSVVYTLATFEIEPVLYLSVPAFLLKDADSVKYYSNIDSVYLVQMIDELPEEPQTKNNTQYAPVEEDFNYIYWAIGLGFFFILVGLVAVVFGRRIWSLLKTRKIERAHRRFMKKYEALRHQSLISPDKKITEDLLKLWKSYMEQLEKQPFTKLTTKEISALYNDNALLTSLKDIDRSLYSDHGQEQKEVSLKVMEDFANARVQRKIEELKHG